MIMKSRESRAASFGFSLNADLVNSERVFFFFLDQPGEFASKFKVPHTSISQLVHVQASSLKVAQGWR